MLLPGDPEDDGQSGVRVRERCRPGVGVKD